MNLYKEAKRPDGLVIRYEGKDGKTLFKLNPKRRTVKPRGAVAPAAKATDAKPTKAAA
jgi:hypothetical protein